MFEQMQASFESLSGQRESRQSRRFCDGAHPLGCVRKIEDANRVGNMDVQEALEPLCSIHDPCQTLGLEHVATLHLSRTLTRKTGRIGAAREIREVSRAPLFALPRGDANHQRAGFRPDPSHQRDKSPIGTENQGIGLGLVRGGGR
jgi:hypothetical protein